jgi:hypothetical protein
MASSALPSASTPAPRKRPSAPPRMRASTFRALTAELEREGVRAFCNSYDELLACIDAKLLTIEALT